MRLLTLSGWGQPHDALSILAPGGLHVDYARHHSVSAALLDISAQAKECDAIIGWSLGGQLAVRAIAAGMLRPRKLVLIAAPFRFVARDKDSIGMKRDLYDKFHDNYALDPARTLRKAWELICKNDSNEDTVRRYLEQQDKAPVLEKDWGRWLELLEDYGCEDLDFSGFPTTLLIHGTRDAVVDAAQSQLFAQRLPQAHNVVLEQCGHAPHWHDTNTVMGYVTQYLNV